MTPAISHVSAEVPHTSQFPFGRLALVVVAVRPILNRADDIATLVQLTFTLPCHIKSPHPEHQEGRWGVGGQEVEGIERIRMIRRLSSIKSGRAQDE